MAAEKQGCMIIGASPILSKEVFFEFPPENYYIICADAGYETALNYGIEPDIVVGDFDSAKQKPPQSLKCVTLPVEKDVTDTMYAAIKGLSTGFKSYVLLGCLGGKRFDHSVANIEVLQYLRLHGAKAVVADEHTKLLVLRDERLKLTKMKGATLSVFPYGAGSCNVSYKGLKYPMERSTLTSGGLLMGVSNSIISDEAEIKVHSGSALVVIYQP